MRDRGRRSWRTMALVVCGVLLVMGCKSGNSTSEAQSQAASGSAEAKPPFMSAVAGSPPVVPAADQAPPPESTGGFDGNRAYAQVAKQVSFGPRPPGTPAIQKLQDYMVGELKSYGCAVDTDSFSADTPDGRVPMKNIIAKIPGQKPGIILLGTHYDTKKLPNFVGADDAGSSTGVMLEMAQLLCKQPPGKYAVWIAFFDAEEAFNLEWKDPDNCYGSRQMAAQMAARGDLPKVKAFILADLVGNRTPKFRRDEASTKWLVDLVWNTAAKLGYGAIFVNETYSVGGDDHFSFTKRNVASVDIIDLAPTEVPYWHTPEDTMDKISPKTLAIVGHTIFESVNQLQKR
jgi:glutaminyl-peptide cyclotransferase